MAYQVASRMAVLLIAAVTIALPSAAAGKQHPDAPAVTELATFAAPGCTGTCGSGSTIGPDGALYVTDGKAGRVLRVDTHSGAVTTFAAADPLMNTPPGIGGAIDVAFVGHTAYVLVANVGPFFGELDEVAGIYRVRRNGSAVPVADIGAWAEGQPARHRVRPSGPGSVRDGALPWRVRGHRRPPRSRAVRPARRSSARAARGPPTPSRRGWRPRVARCSWASRPRCPIFPGRQGRRDHAAVGRPRGDRVRRAAHSRRRASAPIAACTRSRRASGTCRPCPTTSVDWRRQNTGSQPGSTATADSRRSPGRSTVRLRWRSPAGARSW